MTPAEKMPVMLTFDLDAETLWLARDANSADKPIWLSQGRYGPREGLPRILALLKEHDIRATFFIPGLVVERYPRQVETIVADGHEVSHHSYSHRWLEGMSEADERQEMERGTAAIEKATGRTPVGYRSPAGEFSEHTLRLLVEYGFLYSSNLYDADSPYLLEYNGQPTQIVEIPFAWALDDAPFFLYSNRLPGRVMAAPSAVLETWVREFDGLVRESRRTFTLAMHPQVIGRPSRMWVLGELIRHIEAAGGARFARCGEVADEFRSRLSA